VSGTLTVIPATPVVVITPGTYTYDGTSQGPGSGTVNKGGSTGGLILTYAGTGGTLYGPSTIPPVISGNYLVTVTVAADPNFLVGSVGPVVFTIAKRPASVTPTPLGKAFAAPDPTLTGKANGFLASDSITWSYSRIAGEAVGNYVIKAAVSATSLTNYDVRLDTATFTIGKAAPKITWAAPEPIIFGTKLGSTQLNAVPSVAGQLVYSPGDGTLLELGTHTLSVVLTPDDLATYAGPVSAIVTILVNPPNGPVPSNDTARAREAGGVNNGSLGTNPTGNILANDTGTGITVQLIAGTSVPKTGTAILAGKYGSLTIAADGVFTYGVNNALAAVEALNEGQSLQEVFDYTIVDPFNRSAGARLTITIDGTDDAPIAAPIPAVNAVAGKPFGPLTIAAFKDVDNDVLTYTLSGLPAGLSFDPVTRTITGTPTVGGSFEVMITASDGVLSSSASFKVQFSAPPVNQVPVGILKFSSEPSRVVGSDGGSFKVADLDSPVLTVNLASGRGVLTLPALAGVSLVQGTGLNDLSVTLRGTIANLNGALAQLIYQAQSGFFGTDTITITTTDELNNIAVDRIDPPFTVELATLGGNSVSATVASLANPTKQVTTSVVASFDGAILSGAQIVGDAGAGYLSVGTPTRQDGSVQQTVVKVTVSYSDGSSELCDVKVTVYNPTLNLETALRLNPQTSLYEQTVRVTNSTPYAIESYRVVIPTLPGGVTLYSRTATTANGQPTIDDNRPMAPGESRSFLIEYFAPNVQRFQEPAVVLQINSVGPTASPLGATVAVDRVVVGFSNNTYVEFGTTTDRTYWVQYRDVSTSAWQTSPIAVIGTGNVIHWLDQGWPMTTSLPPASRQYQLVVTQGTAPVFTLLSQPESTKVAAGGATSLRVTASGGGPYKYQWYRDGVAVVGATAGTLTIAKAALIDEGSYAVSVSDSRALVTSQPAVVKLITSDPGRIINLSVRGQLDPAGQPMITGFVISGEGTRPILVRAVGETLASFGVAAVARDPIIQLYQGSSLLAENDDWSADLSAGEARAAAAAVGAFALPEASKDAALLRRLLAKNYSLQVRSRTVGGGVVLVEAYDASSRADVSSRIANVSTRAMVSAGDGVLIIGVVISGETTCRILARAIGPTLGSFGITDALADPVLSLFPAGSSGPAASNDDWEAVRPAVEAENLFARAGAFALPVGSKDSVILARLVPGAYSLVVEAKGKLSGQVVIELYLLD